MENQSVICTGNDGLQAERIAKAAKESLLSGQPVKIEHKKYASELMTVNVGMKEIGLSTLLGKRLTKEE